MSDLVWSILFSRSRIPPVDATQTMLGDIANNDLEAILESLQAPGRDNGFAACGDVRSDCLAICLTPLPPSPPSPRMNPADAPGGRIGRTRSDANVDQIGRPPATSTSTPGGLQENDTDIDPDLAADLSALDSLLSGLDAELPDKHQRRLSGASCGAMRWPCLCVNACACACACACTACARGTVSNRGRIRLGLFSCCAPVRH